MALHFSTEYIDELLRRVDMMDVMSRYGIKVKRGVGRNNYYVASFCCGKQDFENGRISKDKQTYKCLACGAGGNAIHFLRNVVRIENGDFHAAVKELASICGMDLPAASESEHIRRKYQAFKLAAEFYHKQGDFAYLLSRGISADVLLKHKAGYAPGGRALREHLEKFGFEKKELQEWRLVNHKGLDFHFHRAIIPIYSNGKVIDLYGRATDDAKAGQKHLYCDGTEILGGIDHIRPAGVVKIFEAPIDRLAAESHGIDNGVDSGGAQKFTAYHARKLKARGVNKAMIIYDGDAAGRNGALATGEHLVREGIQTWVSELPEGTDPAELLQTGGKEVFVAAADRPKPFEKFQMYQLLAKYSLSDLEEYVALRKAEEDQSGGVLAGENIGRRAAL